MNVVEIAVGFFDGIHIGHKKIFNAMLCRAAQKGARTIAMTFINHPREVFAPDKAPKLLMSSSQRLEGIKSLGVDEVIAEKFTSEVASISATQFVERLKKDFPAIDTVFCGPNWTFGKGGEGNPRFLKNLGINVSESVFAEIDGEVVSSTRIRQALEEGDVTLANKMLGREYEISGSVAKGKGIGRTIGYPTINLVFDSIPPLRFGVYALATPFGKAVANWGFAPTAGNQAWESPVMEVHLLECVESDFTPPEKFAVKIKKFIRPEETFDSFAELKAQIDIDVATVING